MTNIPDINFNKIPNKSAKFNQTEFYEENFEKINEQIVPKVNELDAQLAETEQEIMSFKEDYAKLEGINDSVVTPNKTTFIKLSSNLFNHLTESKGFNLSSTDGSLVSNAGYNTSDFIPIKPSTNYSFLGFANVAYYDAAQNFLSRPTLTYAGQTRMSLANAAFIKVHYQPSAQHQRQINEGSQLVAYEPYYEKLSGVDVEIKEKSIGSKELAFLSIGETHLKKGAVTKEKVDFIQNNSNMFDHNTVTVGSIIESSGAITARADYGISDFIEVKPGTTYIAKGFTDVARYDANKNFINRNYFRSVEVKDGGIFQTTEATLYVRYNYQPHTSHNRQMNEGSVLLPYEPHEKVFYDVNLSKRMIETIKNEKDFGAVLKTGDRPMIDVPIDGVFDAESTYDAYPNFGNSTKSAEVYQMYDDLMTAYPDYITKEFLGYDDYENEISLYKFTPKKPNASLTTKHPKIFLTSGVHGYEHVPGLITYLMLKDICEGWENNHLLEALRFNVEFLIIPVVNPSGWDDYSRKNRNGVDINRNFPEGWTLVSDPLDGMYGGEEPASEKETQYVLSVLDANPDIDICYDFHNFSGTQNTDFFIWIPSGGGAYIQHMASLLISRMTRKWRKEHAFIPTDLNWFAGYSDGTTGAMVQDAARARGIKYSATFEVCGRWWIDTSDPTAYNTTHRVTSVEALVNWLLINLQELSK